MKEKAEEGVKKGEGGGGGGKTSEKAGERVREKE